MNQLSELISGTAKRPIIINGRLLTDEGQMVMARRESYRVEFIRVGYGRQESVVEDGEGLMLRAVSAFNEKYGRIMGQGGGAHTDFMANVDTFTGAIVLHNAVFDTLMDKDNAQRLHDPTQQFPVDIQNLLRNFMVDLVAGYFIIYARLFNRRLMASHMPMFVKGHLVAGLYQPLVVATKFIDSPFRMGEFQWLTSYLNSPAVLETYLERMYDTARGIELTAIAMSDLCTKLHLPLVKEMDRLHWMFMLCVVTLGLVVPGGEQRLIGIAPGIWDAITEGKEQHGELTAFYNAFAQSCRSLRNTIAVR